MKKGVDVLGAAVVVAAIVSLFSLSSLIGMAHPNPSHPETIKSLTMADVTHYYQTVFRPDLATIVVTGKVTPERAAAVIQKYLNFWFSSSLDLFGAEVSTNAASYFAAGIKGRPDEGRYDDHRCLESTLAVEMPGGVEQVPLRNAMNEVMRLSYARDCDVGVRRWNKFIEEAGYGFRLALPSPRFNRSLGVWSGIPVDPAGKAIGKPAKLQDAIAPYQLKDSRLKPVKQQYGNLFTMYAVPNGVAPEFECDEQRALKDFEDARLTGIKKKYNGYYAAVLRLQQPRQHR